MAAPTIVSSGNSGQLGSADSSYFFNVTSAQIGDIFLVYTMTNFAGIIGYAPIPDSGVMMNIDSSYNNSTDTDDGYSLFAATVTSGGTNFQLESGLQNGPVGAWTTGYIQLRGGLMAPNYNLLVGGLSNPASIDLSTAATHSGVFVLMNDANGVDTSTANWSTTDGYDPDTGGTVLAKIGVPTFFGFYAAYYPDISPANLYTFSMSGPATYSYGMLAFEVEEDPSAGAGSGSLIAWIGA